MGGQGKAFNRKRKFVGKREHDPEFDLEKKHLKTTHLRACEKRLIIVLEGAQLETVKMRDVFELLNADDHAGIMRKNNRDLGSCRPDITHQCLLMLFDSPLNRAGLLQVYIRTERNVLIEINPQTRIPRTFKRFAGLMVQLLHRFQIRANETSTTLMKVIKNPITDHLPVGCKKYAMSFSGKLRSCRDLVPTKNENNVSNGNNVNVNEETNLTKDDTLKNKQKQNVFSQSNNTVNGKNTNDDDDDDEPVVIIVGAFAHGVVKADYAEDLFSISNYPLSAAIACSKICSAFEEAWGVI